MSNELIYDSLIGESEAIRKIKEIVAKIAPLQTTVLISGETGTGKEIVAKMIHDNSANRQGKFVPVHAAGIPETLLESTLFGHEKGAFTGAYKSQKGYFEIADGGSLFFDEIGETSKSVQVKLLRVLQEGSYNRVGQAESMKTTARIVAATNRNLAQMVKQGTFRKDLYYRLNVITIDIPPLRDRKSDIPLLIQHFISKFSKIYQQAIELQPETLLLLKKYDWPGNVRELENVIERLVALSDSPSIDIDDLPWHFFNSQDPLGCIGDRFLPFAEAKQLFEREYILDVLRRTHGNVSKAARLAQMPRQNLHVKIKKYNIQAKSFEKYDIRSNFDSLN